MLTFCHRNNTGQQAATSQMDPKYQAMQQQTASEHLIAFRNRVAIVYIPFDSHVYVFEFITNHH